MTNKIELSEYKNMIAIRLSNDKVDKHLLTYKLEDSFKAAKTVNKVAKSYNVKATFKKYNFNYIECF